MASRIKLYWSVWVITFGPHERKIATFVVYLKYESVLLKEVREDWRLSLKHYIKKLKPVTLVKQMYSCSVAKNSLKENCTKENIVDGNFPRKGCLENIKILADFK